MQEKQNRIAIYSRKSRFTGKGESIGNQIELCREYISAHYGEAQAQSAVVFEDEGFSGGNLNRPAFKRMIAAAREKHFATIIVYRLDRISRNISDFSGLIEELARLDIAFVSIREQFDTATPMGRAMMYIASVFSQLERETIAERIRDNMHELAKTGRWLGGVTPTGYASESVKSVTIDGKAHKSCKLRLIPQEAEIVKTIFRLFLENNSLTLTEAELMKRRIVTKNGRFFTRFSIKAILQNPVYLIADDDAYRYFTSNGADLFCDQSAFDGQRGVLAYHRTVQAKGQSTVYLPIREWIISAGQHPGLIAGKTWIEIQNRLENNKSKAYRTPRSNAALLTGLLFCQCGSRMYPKLGQRKTPQGQTAFSYVCKLKQRSQRCLCSQSNLSGNQLDEVVVKQLEQLSPDKNTFANQLEQSRRLLRNGTPESENRLFALAQERSETLRKLEGLVDSLADLKGDAARSLTAERIERLDQSVQRIEMQISQLKEQCIQSRLIPSAFDQLCQTFSGFQACLSRMSTQQLRMAVHALSGRIVWDGETAHISLYGALTPLDEDCK